MVDFMILGFVEMQFFYLCDIYNVTNLLIHTIVQVCVNVVFYHLKKSIGFNSYKLLWRSFNSCVNIVLWSTGTLRIRCGRHDIDTDAFVYMKLCDFLKLLSVSTCQCPCRIRCPCFIEIVYEKLILKELILWNWL